MANVLVVDDENFKGNEADVTTYASHIVQVIKWHKPTSRYTFELAFDVAGAIEKIETRNPPYDLIVTDMALPNRFDANVQEQSIEPDGGIRIVRRARKYPFARSIVISAVQEHTFAFDSMKLGAMYFDKQWIEQNDLLGRIVEHHITEVENQVGLKADYNRLAKEVDTLLHERAVRGDMSEDALLRGIRTAEEFIAKFPRLRKQLVNGTDDEKKRAIQDVRDYSSLVRQLFNTLSR